MRARISPGLTISAMLGGDIAKCALNHQKQKLVVAPRMGIEPITYPLRIDRSSN